MMRVANDTEALDQLLSVAWQQAAIHRALRLVAPAELARSLSAGLLLDHFHLLPPLHTPYNAPYMPELLEGAMEPLRFSRLWHLETSVPAGSEALPAGLSFGAFDVSRLAGELLPTSVCVASRQRRRAPSGKCRGGLCAAPVVGRPAARIPGAPGRRAGRLPAHAGRCGTVTAQTTGWSAIVEPLCAVHSPSHSFNPSACVAGWPLGRSVWTWYCAPPDSPRGNACACGAGAALRSARGRGERSSSLPDKDSRNSTPTLRTLRAGGVGAWYPTRVWGAVLDSTLLRDHDSPERRAPDVCVCEFAPRCPAALCSSAILTWHTSEFAGRLPVSAMIERSRIE